jgi:hypothetical protein
MRIVISPYHLTTREPPAMAALLLASQACTLMPAPLQGADQEHVRAAAERVPRYLRFMESWRWTLPLWSAGVLSAGEAGDDVAEEIRAVCERIRRDERLAPLRAFVREDMYADPDRYLDAVAADLLKAGPDPGVSVPVAAGLDRFAARHDMVVSRSGAASFVQRAEERLGQRLGAVAIPIITQGEGGVILQAVSLLEESLSPLREALASVAALSVGNREAARAGSEHLRLAAREFETEFADRRAEIRALGASDDIRVIDGHVTVTLLRLPADAALDASLAAVRAAVKGLAAVAAGGSRVPGSDLPVPLREACAGPVTAMVVRPVGRQN